MDAEKNVSLEGLDLQSSRTNYFLGKEPGRQHTDVPNYARVRYASVYPGVDLVFHGDPSRLEFDLDVAPGTDPSRIRFRLKGAKKISLDPSGNLVAKLDCGEIRLHRPIAFQPTSGGAKSVAAEFVLSSKNEIGFRVGAFDPALPLTIDPVLSYATFLGGSGADTAYAVALDPQHNFYVAGVTASSNFPVSGGVQTTNGGTNDAFVLKIKSDGSGLVYSTFLGGSLADAAQAIAVDSAGNAYVAGFTTSSDFPTKNAFQPALAGGQDVFVTKLSPDGASLAFSTYLGGSGLDTIAAIALDSSNNVVLSGTTKSPDFPVLNALEPTLTGTSGNSDAFVAKLKADGSGLIFSTYLGGTGVDGATGVAISSAGNIWVSGGTGSTDFPVSPNAIQPTFGGGGITNISPGDAFLAEISPNGSSLLYSTYWGGSGQEQATSVSLDANDSVFLVGFTNSTNFPTHSALLPQIVTTTGFNAFISKFSADGATAPFSTYFGGSGSELVFGSAVDSSGNIFISGSTSSTNLPVVNAIQSSYVGGSTDGFVSQLSANGSTLLFSTYLGGTGADSFNRIAVDTSGVYVVGSTDTADFPTAGNLINLFGGSSDGVLVRLAGFTPAPDLALTKTHTGNLVAGADASYTLTISNVGPGPTASAITVTDTLPSGLTYVAASGTNWSCSAAAQTVTCTNPAPIAAGANSVITLTVHVDPTAPSSITNNASVSVSGDTNSSNDSASDVASVAVAPAISVSFGAATIGLNTSTSLTFTLQNPGSTALTGVAFSDTLPTGLVVATPNGLSSTCSGTVTATAATSSISLASATLSGGATCTVVVNITAAGTGVFNDSASTTSSNGGDGNTASATLTVIKPFAVALAFNLSTILQTTNSTLTITFTNPNPSFPLAFDTFSVALPAGLVFPTASSSVPPTTCQLQVATEAQDGSRLTVSGSPLAGGASCTFSLAVNGPTLGTFTTSFSITSALAGTSNTATATLTVNKPAPFQVTSSFNPSTILQTTNSTLTLSFTNPNPSLPLAFNTFAVALPAGLVFPVASSSVPPTTCQLQVATEAVDGSSLTVSGSPLAGGASCTLSFAVNGPTLGTFTTSFSITSALAGPSNTTSATLTVKKPAPFQVAASFNPSTILQTTNSTLTLSFTNPNPSLPLAFNTFAVALPAGLVFPVASSSVPPTTCQLQVATESIDGSSLTVSGSPLAGGASCTFSLAVNGPNLGTFTTSFSITSALAGASNTATATLTVNTNGPVATISPASLTFASQFVGSSSAPQTVTLKNTGNASLSISNVSASGDFSQTNTCGASVASNASCTFTVTFAPTASGTRSGSLTLTDNASGSPQVVSLTGSGADFVLGPAPAATLTATIQRGQTATYNLSIAPTTGLTGTVSFSCTGAPSESTCTVSPATLTTNGTAPSPFAVNVTSTAPTAPPAMLVWQKPGGPIRNPVALIVWGLMALLLILLMAKLREIQNAGRILATRFSRRTIALLSSAVLLFTITVSAVSLGGCSGAAISAPPDLGTPVGTYNVVVTATFTSGASTLKHSLTLTLNVQ